MPSGVHLGSVNGCEASHNTSHLEKLKAAQVLKRFLNNNVATWPLRVEVKSLRLLARAFERASSGNARRLCCNVPAPRQFVTAVEKQKRVLELQRRVTIQSECELSAVRDDGEPENDSSSSCEERVSVESVVHKLFLQGEDTKRQAEAKDARILELEALVASLTSENRHLRHLFLDTKLQAVMMRMTPNSPSCDAECEQLDNQASNQLVRR